MKSIGPSAAWACLSDRALEAWTFVQENDSTKVSNSPASATQVVGSTGVYHHTWLIFVFLVEMGFHHVGQAGLKFLISGNLPASASQSSEIIGHFGRLRQADPLRSGVRDQPGQHGETPSPPKIQKLAGHVLQLSAAMYLIISKFLLKEREKRAQLWSDSKASQLCGVEQQLSCLSLLSSWDYGYPHAWLIFVFLVETGFSYVGQAGLNLLTSSDPPALASQTAGITGMNHN
ncbi:hypothetical protein AAY473_039410 [Plecturocebus cupreus]